MTRIQSIIFDKSKWTPTAAMLWLVDKGFSHNKLDITNNKLRFRQYTPMKSESYKTHVLPGGIEFIIGFN